MAAGRIGIGDRLYRWSKTGGEKTTKYCTIDAHGAQTVLNSTFKLREGLTVKFYGEQGAALLYDSDRQRPAEVVAAMSNAEAAKKRLEAANLDTIRPNDLASLKYVAEMNAKIAAEKEAKLPAYECNASLRIIATGAAAVKEEFSGPDKCPNYNLRKIAKSGSAAAGRSRIDYTDLETLITLHHTGDIITIRNRRHRMDVTLEDVIRVLPLDYTEIRCCFCRVRQAPWQTTADAAHPNVLKP